MPSPILYLFHTMGGSHTRIRVPWPGWLCSSTEPPCSRAQCLTMASPRPVPPVALERLLSTRRTARIPAADAPAQCRCRCPPPPGRRPGRPGRCAIPPSRRAGCTGCVVAQVLAQLIQQLAAAPHHLAASLTGEGHIGFPGIERLGLGTALGHLLQIHRLKLGIRHGLIQTAQLQNIPDQGQKPAGFGADAPANTGMSAGWAMPFSISSA